MPTIMFVNAERIFSSDAVGIKGKLEVEWDEESKRLSLAIAQANLNKKAIERLQEMGSPLDGETEFTFISDELGDVFMNRELIEAQHAINALSGTVFSVGQ